MRRAVTRALYELIGRWLRGSDAAFLNYGYAALDSAGAGSVESHAVDLYRRVVGSVDLGGKDLLEVGSGRGGGASLIMTRFHPRSLVGLDLAANAVAFSQARHQLPGLSFQIGDAENLPFPGSSFDAVVNVESSHNYPSMEQFLREVERVLRPGGYFLFADLRWRWELPELRAQLERSGLTILDDERITPNIMRALELDSDQRTAAVEKAVPRLLRRAALGFAATRGTPMYDGFRQREVEYVRFALRKPG